MANIQTYTKVVWKEWTSDTSDTCTYGTIEDAWSTWVGSTATATWTGSTATATVDAWVRWATDPYWRLEEQRRVVRTPTPEQVREARTEARRKARLAEEAKQRATELLLAHLTPEQAAEFQQHRRFHVIGADGNRYRVDCRRQHQNIVRLNAEGIAVEELCIYAGNGVPLSDNHLAQKLMLETDIDRLKQIANSMDLRRAQ